MTELELSNGNAAKTNPKTIADGPTSTTTIVFSLAILVLLSLAGYQHAVSGTFVFDDTVAIVKNQDVNSKPTNLTAIFLHDFWGAPLNDVDSHKSYRPLTTLMFHIEYAHLQLRSKHMKIINLLLHCINTCLLWKLFINLSNVEEMTISFSNCQVSTIAAALFAVHPVHTEAVCGIVGRTELMFCLCLLLSLLTVIRKKSTSIEVWDIVIVGLALLGLLFKESAITILPTCILFNYIRQCLYKKPLWEQLEKLITLPNILYTLVCSILLVWRLWLQNFESPKFKTMDNPIAFSTNSWTRCLSQSFLYALNCWILFCPQWLSFDWALGCIEPIQSIVDIRLLSILFFYVFLILIIWRSKENLYLLLSMVFLVIPFLPASGLIKVGFVIAERVLYVPSIGFCLLVAYSFVNLADIIKNDKLLKLHKLLLMFVFFCFLLRTRERATDWITEEKLFSSALSVCPRNAKVTFKYLLFNKIIYSYIFQVHYNIARLATDKFERQKAFQHYHKAITLYPQYESALMNLGNLYREIGDLHTAEKYLMAALDVLPEFPAAWMNLGIVQSALKKYNAALKSYQKALVYRKRYAICHYNMGNLYLDLQQYSEAMHHWQESVALNAKQPKAWANILTMLDNRGLYEDAVRLSAKALEHLPKETGIMFIRANVFGKLQHYIEAEALYKSIIMVDPLNILYHTNLGVLYHRWGKVNLAIDSYQQALKLNPKNAKTAHDNLAKLLKRRREE